MLMDLFKWKVTSIFLMTVLTNTFCYTPTLGAEKLPKSLQRVLSHRGAVTLVRQSTKPLIKLADLPKSFETDGQNLVKTTEGLFLIPEGTGRVYQWQGDAESGAWTRIDSTYFTGYNYGALVFSVGKEIYSFGGQGFWNTNGNLRYYNGVSREWNVVYLNQSYPWFRRNYAAQSFFQLDSASKKLYVVSAGAQHDQAIQNTGNPKSDGTIMALDLATGTWEKLGTTDSTEFVTLAITPWGMYVNNTAIIDLKTNKKYVLSNSLKKDWETHVLRSTGNHELDIVFAIDSTIYFGDYDARLDSIQVRRQDLIELDDSFYILNKKEKSGSEMMWIGAIAMMVISPLIAHFVVRNKKKKSESRFIPAQDHEKQADFRQAETPLFRSTIQANILDDQEVLLIKFILDQSLKSELTSIEQINQLLGLSNRSGEVQKRTRSILITGINEKLQIALGSMEPIIEKKRSEFDKRSYEYFIVPNYFNFVNEILNNVKREDS
jgi:hypothetical protein